MTNVHDQIRESLSRLDGTRTAVVAEITGLSREHLEELGGVPEHV